MIFFVSAGEPSGDIHAAALIRKIRETAPDTVFTGFGGPRMKEAGCILAADLTKFAVMWFWHAVKKYFRFRKLLAEARTLFQTKKFDAVILVDYPGFNWHIAKAAKEQGIPVIYFMPPQIWAWARWRIKKMRAFVDIILCPIHFEWKWFQQQNCKAVFIGHPFFEEIRTKKSDPVFLEQFYTEYGSAPVLTILAGSRHQEISANLDDLLRTVQKIQTQRPDIQPVFAAFNEEQAARIRRRLTVKKMSVPVFAGRTTELIRAADCCLAVSGSVSMELLACHKPAVIYYRVCRISLFIQRFFRRTKYITLVNLIGAAGTRGQSPFYSDSVRMIPKEPSMQARQQMFFPEFLTAADRSGEAADILTAWLSQPKLLAWEQRRLETLHTETDTVESPLALAAQNILEMSRR
ncbi:MAG: lipid-A-disaccharide synthase [Planctomycetaceae bacterium]|jgi:lipid-A-disaccharide synthase|nr:lipid-A-disaccharide synthase [Planctomycetaceae bacterium]